LRQTNQNPKVIKTTEKIRRKVGIFRVAVVE